MDQNGGLNNGRPRRRSVLTRGGWILPAVAVGAAAPTLAASDPPSVTGNGSITRTSCGATTTAPGTVAVTFDSRPSYSSTTEPTNGFWVNNLPTSVTVTSATRTIYVDSRFTNVSWSYAGTSTNQRQWSLPKRDPNAPTIAGLVAYSSTYQPTLTPAWTTVNGTTPPYSIATYGVFFNLSATTPANTCNGLFNFRTYRTAILSNGTILTNLKSLATA